MKYFFFFVYMSSFISAKEELCICCIFKDDSKYLPEWIEFHVKQGASHFYLYNNLSTDNYKEILQPYLDQGTADLIDWPLTYTTEQEWTTIQCEAYMNCVRISKDKFKWCAFLDTDEFLFSPLGKITDILPKYQAYPGVCVYWLMYGTSQVEKVPEGEKITNYLVFRSEQTYIENFHFKTIARLDRIDKCVNPHFFYYQNDKKAVDENFKIMSECNSHNNSVRNLRINHYWSRDRDFFYNQKLSRRIKWSYAYNRQIEMESQMNYVYDPILAD